MAKGVSGEAGMVGHRFPDLLPLHPPQARHAFLLRCRKDAGHCFRVTLPSFYKLPCCNMLGKCNGSARCCDAMWHYGYEHLCTLELWFAQLLDQSTGSRHTGGRSGV